MMLSPDQREKLEINIIDQALEPILEELINTAGSEKTQILSQIFQNLRYSHSSLSELLQGVNSKRVIARINDIHHHLHTEVGLAEYWKSTVSSNEPVGVMQKAIKRIVIFYLGETAFALAQGRHYTQAPEVYRLKMRAAGIPVAADAEYEAMPIEVDADAIEQLLRNTTVQPPGARKRLEDGLRRDNNIVLTTEYLNLMANDDKCAGFAQAIEMCLSFLSTANPNLVKQNNFDNIVTYINTVGFNNLEVVIYLLSEARLLTQENFDFVVAQSEYAQALAEVIVLLPASLLTPDNRNDLISNIEHLSEIEDACKHLPDDDSLAQDHFDEVISRFARTMRASR